MSARRTRRPASSEAAEEVILTPVDAAVCPPPSAMEGTMSRRLLAGMVLVLALGYALGSAPSALPWSQEWHIIKTLGFDNAVAFVLLNAVGLFAPVMAALMVPSMVSANQVPLWPFLLACFPFGTVALLPYLVLWEASPQHNQRSVPPTPSDLAGGRNWLLRLTEGKALPRVLLATEAALALLLAGTNAATWADFWRLFHQSRLVHLATLDFVALTVLSGLIAAYDASRRGVPRNVLVPVAAGCMIPLVGPTVYLLLRPSAYVAPGAPVRVRARRAGAAVRGAAKKSTGWLERVLPAGVHDALAGAWEAVPGRRWFEARLAAVKHRLRRVGSTVFQGLHTERERRPVRQTSVASEHGIEWDSDKEHEEHHEEEDEDEDEETDELGDEEHAEEEVSEEEEAAPAGDELDVIDRDQAPARGGRPARKTAAAADSGRASGKVSLGSSGRGASKPYVTDIDITNTRVKTRVS